MKQVATRNRGVLAIAAFALWVGACTPVSPLEEIAVTLPGVAPGGRDLTYLAVPPRDRHEQGWPLLVFLHGSGESGGELSQVKVHGPVKAAAAMADFPFLVVAPHLPDGALWEPQGVMAVVDDALRRWPVDENRIYLTGLSLGAHGTWATAIEHPRRFAAIVPISGHGDPDSACTLSELPIWAFHGVVDDVVAVEGSHAMVDAVRGCGGRPGLTLYADVGHDAWTRTYDDPALYAWLLSHVRNGDKNGD